MLHWRTPFGNTLSVTPFLGPQCTCEVVHRLPYSLLCRGNWISLFKVLHIFSLTMQTCFPKLCHYLMNVCFMSLCIFQQNCIHQADVRFVLWSCNWIPKSFDWDSELCPCFKRLALSLLHIYWFQISVYKYTRLDSIRLCTSQNCGGRPKNK